MNYANSRKSDFSYSSGGLSLERIFDFSILSIPGLFKCSASKFYVDYKEGDLVVSSSYRTRDLQICAKLSNLSLIQYGIQYTSHIKVTHETSEEFIILIPDSRSYNPCNKIKPYLTNFEYIFLVKFMSILIRAAIAGIVESKIDGIKEKIVKISKVYEEVKQIAEWVYLQIKYAFFKKEAAPKLFEEIIRNFENDFNILENNDHCKEYLENCLSGEEMFLPSFYYRSVLDNEKNLAFPKIVNFTEILVRRNDKKNKTIVLKHLPKFWNSVLYVKQGKNLLKLKEDTEKYWKIANSEELKNPCWVF